MGIRACMGWLCRWGKLERKGVGSRELVYDSVWELALVAREGGAMCVYVVISTSILKLRPRAWNFVPQFELLAEA